MKKITLLLLSLFFSIVGYAQFTPTVEGFENTTGPDPSPSTNWTLSTGNWTVFGNGFGNTFRWGINATVAQPPIVYQGTNAAYCNRENLNPNVPNTLQDYLVSPLVNIPSNGELHFFTRMFQVADQGSAFKIMVAPSTITDVTDINNYTPVQVWSEADLLSGNFNVYQEKVVSLLLLYLKILKKIQHF